MRGPVSRSRPPVGGLIVDPSSTTRTRHIEFFSRVAPEARVFVFNTVRQFARVLG